MSSDVAIRIRGLGKKYTIKHKDHDHVTLAQSALHRLRHPRTARPTEEFWALQNVEFDVPHGEVLGVIGHNGAGKSTLLKILSRITPPTTGEVQVFGRIGSLLEVGTGFHPELTGRENVYLNGSILGMRKREIDKQFDAIVAFAGVEHFLDTPVKRYSSGMYVRLAFAVAAHLDTEILLIDEVLAVGDGDFQKKCLGKMGEVANAGRTVILVSHNLAAVAHLCRNVLLLAQGSIVTTASRDEALQAYESGASLEQAASWDLTDAARFTNLLPDPPFRLAAVHFPLGTSTITDDQPLEIQFDVDVRRRQQFSVGLGIIAPDGTAMGVGYTNLIEPLSVGRFRVGVSANDLGLAPASYRLVVSLCSGNERSAQFTEIDGVVGAATIHVVSSVAGAATWRREWGWRRLTSIEGCLVEGSLR